MFIIDRFEGDMVVIEYEGKSYAWPRKILPAQVREGDVITIAISVDQQATRERQEKIKRLTDQLFE
ncbi:MAG: DUF3006 domain-containing protein [Syntrophomonadaceae bacterium]|jgi:hypothetical protein